MILMGLSGQDVAQAARETKGIATLAVAIEAKKALRVVMRDAPFDQGGQSVFK
jgi:hypothetical protein